MALRYSDGNIVLGGVTPVEEAEPLCQLLTAHPTAGLDLTDCQHVHTSVLQVLMAARRVVTGGPKDPFLAGFVLPALLRAAASPEERELNQTPSGSQPS